MALALAEPPAPRGAAAACLSPATGADAVAACQAALRSAPSPSRASRLRLALARAFVAAARYPEAVEAYAGCVRAEPADPEAHLRFAVAQLRLGGDAEAAADAAREAVQLAPEDAHAYGVLGEALHAQGEHPEAAAAFAEARRLDPAFFENRPAARAMDLSSQGGGAWPPSP